MRHASARARRPRHGVERHSLYTMPRSRAPRGTTQTRGNANYSQHARAMFWARACCEQFALPRVATRGADDRGIV
eukprot:354903-Lingulodinium_polyedra.AAC.1